MKNTTFRIHRKALLLTAAAILLLMNLVCAYADDAKDIPFSDLITKFVQDGIIPDEPGSYLKIGDFEDSYANMGYYSVTPLLKAEHFVLTADISWSSGNKTPNGMVSGCGVVFNAAGDSTDHVMMSLRMDGNIYFSGAKGYNNLSWGKFTYGTPTSSGNTKLVLVISGTQAIVYINGQRILQRSELAVLGDTVGLAVLAGTYQDFGTRCNFRNMEIYTW